MQIYNNFYITQNYNTWINKTQTINTQKKLCFQVIKLNVNLANVFWCWGHIGSQKGHHKSTSVWAATLDLQKCLFNFPKARDTNLIFVAFMTVDVNLFHIDFIKVFFPLSSHVIYNFPVAACEMQWCLAAYPAHYKLFNMSHLAVSYSENCGRQKQSIIIRLWKHMQSYMHNKAI